MNAAALANQASRLHRAGMASSDNGRPAVAVRQLRAGLRLLDGRPGEQDPVIVDVRGRLLVSLAWAESERGRVDVGFRLLDEAEPLIPYRQRPVLLAQRALLLKRAGRNDLALPLYDEAVALLAEQSNPLDLVKALNNRSIVHLDAGNVRLARADLHRCRQIAGRHGLAVHAALSRTNLGCLDVLAGDLPSALRAFASARTEYETVAPGRLPNLAVERARALVAAGLFTEADGELADAIERADRQRLSHTYADALQVRAEAALLAGRPAAAGQWAQQARARFLGRENAGRVAVASLLELRAEQATGGTAGASIAARAQALAGRLGRLGMREDARVAALVATRALIVAGRPERAERIATRYGPPGRVDRLDTRLLWRLTRAELSTVAGQPAEANRQLVAGMATLHRHRAQFGCLDLQTGAAVHGRDLARAGVRAALASGSPAAAYRWSERAKAQALLLPPVRPPTDPAAATALEELRQARHALRAAELAGQATGRLRSRVAALQGVVREHSWSTPGQRRVTGPGLAPLTAVRDRLGDAALVAYLRDGPALRALVLVGGSPVLLTLGEYAAAEAAVLRLRADLDARAGRAMPRRLADAVSAATRQDADALAAAVLDPILRLVGDRDLVVVPTGTLMTVPWGVLPACRGRPVTVAPSATVWLTAQNRRTASRRTGDGTASQPAISSATGHPATQPPALLVAGPGIERGTAEVLTVAALHPQAIVLTGSDATPAATLTRFGEVAVAHLAAHGRHQAENALFSTLELFGGPLLGYDLQRVAGAPPMVVLSSCDLGLTDIRPGDETFGMVTALLSAGSATVVASVARVADETAMTVMVGFHRGVASGHAPAAALASALAPYGDAGFVCFGAG